MTEHAPDRIWSGIEISKVLAGTLAAISAAVVGSFLGVAGTLAGAAVASIVGSVGTEIYAKSINRGARKLQELTPAFVKAPAAVGTPEVAAATGEESPSHTVAAPERARPRWARVALAAGVLFVLALGSLTVVELLAGRSVASMVGHDSSGTTTVSSVTDSRGRTDDTPVPAPSGSTPSSPSASEEPADEPGAGPSGAPDPGAGTPSPDATTAPTGPTDPTGPTTEPTTRPNTDAPTAPQEQRDQAPAEQAPDEAP